MKKNKKTILINADYSALELRMLAQLGARHTELDREIGLTFDKTPVTLYGTGRIKLHDKFGDIC